MRATLSGLAVCDWAMVVDALTFPSVQNQPRISTRASLNLAIAGTSTHGAPVVIRSFVPICPVVTHRRRPSRVTVGQRWCIVVSDEWVRDSSSRIGSSMTSASYLSVTTRHSLSPVSWLRARTSSPTTRSSIPIHPRLVMISVWSSRHQWFESPMPFTSIGWTSSDIRMRSSSSARSFMSVSRIARSISMNRMASARSLLPATITGTALSGRSWLSTDSVATNIRRSIVDIAGPCLPNGYVISFSSDGTNRMPLRARRLRSFAFRLTVSRWRISHWVWIAFSGVSARSIHCDEGRQIRPRTSWAAISCAIAVRSTLPIPAGGIV